MATVMGLVIVIVTFIAMVVVALQPLHSCRHSYSDRYGYGYGCSHGFGYSLSYTMYCSRYTYSYSKVEVVAVIAVIIRPLTHRPHARDEATDTGYTQLLQEQAATNLLTDNQRRQYTPTQGAQYGLIKK